LIPKARQSKREKPGKEETSVGISRSPYCKVTLIPEETPPSSTKILGTGQWIKVEETKDPVTVCPNE